MPSPKRTKPKRVKRRKWNVTISDGSVGLSAKMTIAEIRKMLVAAANQGGAG